MKRLDREAFYLRLGFSSLYDSYRSSEESNKDFSDNLDIYIKNTSQQYVLNDNMEIGIDGSYYKYVRQDLIASGTNLADIKSLGGPQLWLPGILITDHVNNEIIRPDGTLPGAEGDGPNDGNGNGGNSEPREPCEIVVSIVDIERISVEPLVVRPLIRVEFINENGGTPFCGGDLKVTWGDGSTSQHSNVNIGEGGYLLTNQYDPSPDGVFTNTITIEFTPTICGLCTSFSEGSITHITSNKPTCMDDEYDDHFATLFYENENKRVRFYKNYDMEDWGPWDAHIGGKVKVYRKQSGDWKNYDADKVVVKIIGRIWEEDDCTEQLDFILEGRSKTDDNEIHFNFDIENDYRANRYEENIEVEYEVYDYSQNDPVLTFSTELFNY